MSDKVQPHKEVYHYLLTMLLLACVITFFVMNQADDRFRPQYHLMPPRFWLNDPNGPVYFNGYYHMFFQYTPNSPTSGLKYWGHCYSEDMVHWIRLPIALAPDRPFDINGIWTGSTTVVDAVPTIIYTGINEDQQQVQCQARPANLTDPTLTTWTKSLSNPLITSPNGRDPATAFRDDQDNYYLIYGFGTDELGGQAVLFTSRDFTNWTYLHPIHSNHYDSFWECPDIFNISDRVVMKASLRGQDFWAVGELDPLKKIFLPLAGDLGEYRQLVDQGRFYASKSFYDPISHQQVIFGWISEDDDRGEERGWQGLLSLPRSISLSDDGLKICSRPIAALESLRDPASHRSFHTIVLPPPVSFELIPDIRGNQIEVMINWQFQGDQDFDFGLSVLSTADGRQRTSIGLLTRTNISDMSHWDLPGWDYASVANINSSIDCQRSCNGDTKCYSWTFDSSKAIDNNCFLKSGIPLVVPNAACTSGVKERATNDQLVWIYINRSLSQENPSAAHSPHYGAIWMENTIENQLISLALDIYIDHSVIEVFEPKGGRVALTTRVYPEDPMAENLAVYLNHASTSDPPVVIDTLDFWTLSSIWTGTQ